MPSIVPQLYSELYKRYLFHTQMCTGRVTVHVTPGDHLTFIQGDNVVKVARIITSLLTGKPHD